MASTRNAPEVEIKQDKLVRELFTIKEISAIFATDLESKYGYTSFLTKAGAKVIFSCLRLFSGAANVGVD